MSFAHVFKSWPGLARLIHVGNELMKEAIDWQAQQLEKEQKREQEIKQKHRWSRVKESMDNKRKICDAQVIVQFIAQEKLH